MVSNVGRLDFTLFLLSDDALKDVRFTPFIAQELCDPANRMARMAYALMKNKTEFRAAQAA